MELVERDNFLSMMHETFDEVITGEGHCILISGEAGIGKTSLVRFFFNEKKEDCQIYFGACDALFTPRPLSPVYDIALQIKDKTWDTDDRSMLFTGIFRELEIQKKASLIIVEDIHWADEATFDFLKFFIRRITQLHCLLLITYRDSEIHSSHPLRTVLGQLPPDFFTRLQLSPLSRGAVETMAAAKGYKGEDVYSISGGNPFYVNEILASYSTGIPDNIKDSILSVYNRQNEKTKQVWQILSVIPSGLEVKYLEKLEPYYSEAIENSIDTKILIMKEGLISFKHELYRRTIETSLSPLIRRDINKRMLDILVENSDQSREMERIIHHAKNASENEIVVKYAPLAAKEASSVGAHLEAAKLYLTAIEYYREKDKNTLIDFYKAYAYECYLTNQLKDGIIHIGKAISFLELKNDIVSMSTCLHLLSWLWWFDGNGKKAEDAARKNIKLLANQPLSGATAMAFAHLGRLKMLSDETEECLHWSEKAMAMAKELANEEIICYTLNSIGTMYAKNIPTRKKGLELLQQSMDIAVKINHEEYIGHAYANLSANAVRMKDYVNAQKILDAATQFLEERDIDLGTKYLLAYETRLALETGNWAKANSIVSNFINNDDLPPIGKIGVLIVAGTIKMRRGEANALALLLEALDKALNTGEPQRLAPALTAMLEYEWIAGRRVIENPVLDNVINMIKQRGNIYENSAFAFWLFKARKQKLLLNEFYEGYLIESMAMALKASALWKQLGCPYEQALTLFEGDDDNKKAAIAIIQKLGADPIYEKMRLEMKSSGIKSIPRGIRKSTKSNPANLTEREVGVIQLLKDGLQNKEIAAKLFISPKTVDHHISSIFLKLDVNSRTKAVQEASRLEIVK
ncbi:MAG TPA: LuxR C-terminal-related transcriptional regulator [Chitinophagaceae bacterium]|nr:LuxR C-terminal-related transcriptional regulator [Chitinophagaceae bacterium]